MIKEARYAARLRFAGSLPERAGRTQSVEICRLSHKLPLSTDHLAAAVVFAVQARELERRVAKPLVLHSSSEHKAAGMACVLSSVAYLEANINEFVSNAADENVADGIAGTAVAITRLKGVWGTTASNVSILDKYDLVLALCDLPTFTKGTAPYQSAALLIRLRNVLTHFEPSWEPSGGPHEDTNLTRLSRSLRRLFPENSLAEPYQPYFMQRCLGFGSSKWAISTIVAFVTEFRKRLGVGFSPTYLLPYIDQL